MEGEEQEEHHNEAEPPEPAGDDARSFAGTTTGASRFYECVFCERGFSTAQALGGHMNIHRRHRAKIRPAHLAPPRPRRAEEAHHPYSYSREQRRTQPQAVVSNSSNYVVYLPGSSSTSGSGDKKELVLAGEELQLGLGGPGQEIRKEKEKDQVSSEILDLELRLGHSKRHGSS